MDLCRYFHTKWSTILLLLLILYLYNRDTCTWREFPGPEAPDIASEAGVYFVNTSRCRMCAMDAVSPKALSFVQRLGPFKCSKVQLLRAATIKGHNYLIRDLVELDLWRCCAVRRLRDVFCAYQQLQYCTDFRTHVLGIQSFALDPRSEYMRVPDGLQMLRVYCWVDFGRVIFHDVLLFVPPPHATHLVPERGEGVPSVRLSVLVLGIDSLSHLHYRRSFPHVAAYIRHLPHTELWGYNRVGDNSYPNIVPLLTGLTAQELERRCLRRRRSYDECRFLWNEFHDAGYMTAFGEDTAKGGTFTYRKRGFEHQPTDFYLRPVLQEMRLHTTYEARGDFDVKCTAGRRYEEVLFDFVQRLMPHMQQRDFFAFMWQTQGVHDYFNYARIADQDYLQLLQQLHQSRILDNTLVLLLSDHGLRFDPFAKTFQGMQEASQPLGIALYPPWLQRHFPFAMRNLHRNAHRLVTTFDLHETLKDVMDLKGRLRDASIRNRSHRLGNPRGVSLFLPIPEQRDCRSAHIPDHYCLCHTLKQIPKDTPTVQRIAGFIVSHINHLLRPYPQCRQLSLEEIDRAYVRRDHGAAVGSTDQSTITVLVVTEPGNGHFAGTALASNVTALHGRITRSDAYGAQAYCIRDFRFEMYCYCG
ncbi:uncharacterized protein LOC117586510 [Drosophila guanche]|uniref:DUF229 domain containing protein n=1 Tax=Drosophila guanche TaxID=7266 RepID=A0A3B0JN29_DROGU|nr:uncharacterized protein LOC117586510 [Drosophila guanche]SPP83645.1 Hypothetical predicted protein [Drosophila guanche]